MHHLQHLGKRSYLVGLYENRIGDTRVNAFLESLGIGHEKIVADKLYLAAKLIRQHLPAVRIAHVKTVLDRYDRILSAKTGVIVAKLS